MEATTVGVFVGIDWSDAKHDVCEQAAGSLEVTSTIIGQSAEAIEEWVTKLRVKYPGQRIAVCLEQSRGALIYALLKYESFELYPINPSTLAKYREAFRPNGGKDDESDAEFLLELVSQHRNRLRVLRPDEERTRKLQYLVEYRRKLVNERTRLSNRLTAYLKSYFPQILSWFPDIKTPLVCDFLERWTTLEALQAEKPETVDAFLRAHGSRSEAKNAARLAEIAVAIPLVTDRAIVESLVLMVRALVVQMRSILQTVQMFDSEIQQLFTEHPDAAVFESFPGAGEQYAPRLLAAFGSQRERFQTAAEAACFFGIAPKIEQSGKHRAVRWRIYCPKFLRQTLHEFAHQSVQQCEWAKSFYAQARARGKSHHAAIRALAFKWIRILWRCWQDRAAYDDARYLKNKRGRIAIAA